MPSIPEASLRGRIAAHARWAKTEDRAAATAAARRAYLQSFERQVDPAGVLAPEERAFRAVHARKAHLYRLALKAHQAREAHRDDEVVVPSDALEDDL